MRTIHSIGSSTLDKDEFVLLLRHFQIVALADVRSYPSSRFPHFIKSNLEPELSKVQIRYVYLGKELGGFRKGSYLDYTTTADYEKGLTLLESIAENESTAFMCAERFPWKCHRQFIGQSLKARGWEVLHIIDKDTLWKPLL